MDFRPEIIITLLSERFGVGDATTATEDEKKMAAQFENMLLSKSFGGLESNENEELDPFDLLEAKDISRDLNTEFYEKLTSTKWTERKEAMEGLLNVLEKNPKLSTNLDIYRQLISEIKKIIEKDSNINVLGLAVKVLASLASGLRGSFAAFIPSVLPPLITKSKEKKEAFAGPFLNCIDVIELAPKLGLLTADAAPEVRDASYAAIGSIIRCIGEAAAAQLFNDVLNDSLKKSKIEEKTKEFCDQYGDEVVPEMKKIYSQSSESARPSQSAPKSAAPRSAASTRPVASRPTPAVKRDPIVAAKKPMPVNVRPQSTASPNIVSRPSGSATTQRSIPPNVRPNPAPVSKPMSAQRSSRPLGVTPISVARSASSSRINPIKPNVVRHSVAPPSTDRPISKPEPLINGRASGLPPPRRSIMPVPTSAISRAQSSMTGKSLIS